MIIIFKIEKSFELKIMQNWFKLTPNYLQIL
jgi:hypothetical protein